MWNEYKLGGSNKQFLTNFVEGCECFRQCRCHIQHWLYILQPTISQLFLILGFLFEKQQDSTQGSLVSTK